MAARFLIVGASGLVGRRLLRTIGIGRATGTYYRHPIPDGIPFDMAAGSLGDVLDVAGDGFSHLVILGAISNIDACAQDPMGAAKINIEAACRLADDAARRGIVPIFSSSDAVYDGSHAMWREDDQARPIIVYGRQKLEVEARLRRADYPCLILRIAKVLDAELDSAGVLGPWLRDLAEGRLIRCATDQFFTPIGADDLTKVIIGLGESGATGTFNVGGEATSRIELLNTTIAAASAFSKVAPRVDRCRLNDLPFIERRPLDLRLVTEKLRAAIAFTPEPLAALCRRAAGNFFNARTGHG